MDYLRFGEEPSRKAYAAVCKRKHIFTWDTETHEVLPGCARCGSTVITTCPGCGERLPGNDNIYEDAPYQADYCVYCFKAYPWRSEALEAAERQFTMQADLDDWDAATKAYADDFLSDVKNETATKSSVERMERWFIQKGYSASAEMVRDIVISIGADALKSALGLSSKG